ncbi:MAG: hypothetical protein AAEJ65_06520, partial [Planctomycetota bacterium]
LTAAGSPSSNITFDPDELGGHGSLVVNDYSGDNRYLRGSLGGVTLSNATIFWLGYFDPGRDGSLGDGSGQYIYSFGKSVSAGSQLDAQIDDGRFEIYGGSGTQAGRDITYLNGYYSTWMTRFHAAPTSVGHEAEANGFDMLVPPDGSGYSAGGTDPGADDLMLFAWQNSSGNSDGYNFVGNLHQVLIYDGLLDSNDTAAINNYLSSKLQKEPPGPNRDQDLITRVVSISGVNGNANDAPDIYFPHGDPQVLGEATFLINPNNNTMDWVIELEDDRYIVTQTHMYSPHYKPNGDSIFCWGGRWSYHDFLAGTGYSLHGAHLQEMIDTPSMWTLVIHTEGGHFAVDENGELIPYDGAAHETSESGQVESGARYNNRVPRRLDNRLLREQNPYSGGFGDSTFDAVYPDPDHFLRENPTPFPDADGNQWISYDDDADRWVPSEYGASRGLTNDDIDNVEYLFYRYDDQGPSWDYGGPEGAAGGILREPEECPVDFNGDGLVDAADLGLLLAAWGLDGATDINGDGTTDVADLQMMLAAWGPCA